MIRQRSSTIVDKADDRTTRDQRLDEVISGYLEAVASGQLPDRRELLVRHPDLAADLPAFSIDDQAGFAVLLDVVRFFLRVRHWRASYFISPVSRSLPRSRNQLRGTLSQQVGGGLLPQ